MCIEPPKPDTLRRPWPEGLHLNIPQEQRVWFYFRVFSFVICLRKYGLDVKKRGFLTTAFIVEKG